MHSCHVKDNSFKTAGIIIVTHFVGSKSETIGIYCYWKASKVSVILFTVVCTYLNYFDQNWNYPLINLKWGWGKFEPCLAGVENLNPECQVFLAKYRCYVFKYGDALGKQFNFVRKWLGRRRSISLVNVYKICLLQKSWMGHLNTIFSIRGWEFEHTNLKVKCQGARGGGMLIDALLWDILYNRSGAWRVNMYSVAHSYMKLCYHNLRRLPQLFCKDVALIQRLFQALCQVGLL